MKKRKDTILLKIESNLPIKDSMLGSNNATIDLAIKNIPMTVNPAKPTLPDLYQLKLLYLESIKKKR